MALAIIDYRARGLYRICKGGGQSCWAPILMFVNIYTGELPIRKTCNFDKSLALNNVLKVTDGTMHRFCCVCNKSHMIMMIDWQPSQFYIDPLYEA